MFALRLGLQFDDLGDDRDVCDRSEFGSCLPWVSYIESHTFGTRIDLFSVLSVYSSDRSRHRPSSSSRSRSRRSGRSSGIGTG